MNDVKDTSLLINIMFLGTFFFFFGVWGFFEGSNNPNCKVYDKVKEQCVEYDSTTEKIFFDSLERPVSFYDDYDCYITPVRDSEVDGIGIKCFPENGKVVVEIPVKEEFYKESEKWKVLIEAKKGKIEEKSSFIVLFEPIIDEKTERI